MKKWSITGINILTPNGLQENSNISFSNKKIDKISKRSINSPLAIEIDGILAPGLINAHDHLLGTYFPKVGNGPYENWLPWDNDLKSSPVYEERQQIENKDLYLLGAYRNLVSGVTTVSDHIPHFVGDPFYDILPTKAIKDFTMAHSIASFALAWGEGPDLEYERAAEKDIPFITHIAEGFDNETINDIKTLNRLGALGDHSVLVHGIAFSEEDMNLIKKRGASVVWCADSNIFMFEQTTNIKMLLDKGINVCIGTDSPMSGGLNLLYEMKFDKAYYEKRYEEELPDTAIYKMVTENPAKGFWQPTIGKVKEGFTADLIVIEDKGGSAENSIVRADIKDIKLVILEGKPVYGNAEYSEIFDELKVTYQPITIDGSEKIIIGDLIGLLQRISRAVGFKKTFPFLPVDFDF